MVVFPQEFLKQQDSDILHASCFKESIFLPPSVVKQHSMAHPMRLYQVTWGTITMVDAARQLLRTALQDPLNQKFMMLSESGIPLWPPQFVYQQLLAENRSRLDSCGIKVGSLAPI